MHHHIKAVSGSAGGSSRCGLWADPPRSPAISLSTIHLDCERESWRIQRVFSVQLAVHGQGAADVVQGKHAVGVSCAGKTEQRESVRLNRSCELLSRASAMRRGSVEGRHVHHPCSFPHSTWMLPAPSHLLFPWADRPPLTFSHICKPLLLWNCFFQNHDHRIF